MVGAIAVGVGIAGAGFASTVMSRYQRWAMIASIAFMAVWLARTAHASGIHLGNLRRLRRHLVRHLAFMAAAYGVTITLALGVSAAITAAR